MRRVRDRFDHVQLLAYARADRDRVTRREALRARHRDRLIALCGFGASACSPARGPGPSDRRWSRTQAPSRPASAPPACRRPARPPAHRHCPRARRTRSDWIYGVFLVQFGRQSFTSGRRQRRDERRRPARGVEHVQVRLVPLWRLPLRVGVRRQYVFGDEVDVRAIVGDRRHADDAAAPRLRRRTHCAPTGWS